MLTNEFKEVTLSRLGFGTMRLPVNEDKSIQEDKVQEMVDYAIAHGINYFDTAWVYHGGHSEGCIGKALSKYPRDRWYLADKYPGHQISDHYDPANVFERQLKRCGVDYFDFYLLHNVYENDIDVYMDPQWGILDYFTEQKKQGRIRHLGFSSHARPETLEKFLKYADGRMEFCQIQLNYLDWTLQEAEEKCRILEKYGIPVWVMEPVRGGKLANLPQDAEERLRQYRPDDSDASWGFRWLQQFPNIKMVLSGMTNLDQMKDNIETFTEDRPLSKEENDVLMDIAEVLKNAVPCTGCRYCCDGCPQELDIPYLMKAYSDVHYAISNTVSMQLDAMPKEKWPSACIGCGQCASICPQKIDVPKILEEFSAMLPKLPNWKKICEERAEDERRMGGK